MTNRQGRLLSRPAPGDPQSEVAGLTLQACRDLHFLPAAVLQTIDQQGHGVFLVHALLLCEFQRQRWDEARVPNAVALYHLACARGISEAAVRQHQGGQRLLRGDVN
ncbi:hypothetical protein D3C77_636840 [compost metagenome]